MSARGKVMNGDSSPKRIFESKRYPVAEAARLAGTSAQNARRWIKGYSTPGHRMEPVFGHRHGPDEPRLSFVELVELAVVARFRGASARPIPLERLRAAHRFAREQLGVDYPFASQRMLVEGGHVLWEFERDDPGGPRLVLDMHGQHVLPGVVLEELQHMDFDEPSGLVVRWFPRGRDASIVVDPERGGGRPIVAGTNIRAEVVRARFDSGESVQDLAEEFEIGIPAVEAALRAA